VVDVGALRIVLGALTGWLDRREPQPLRTCSKRIGCCGVSLVDVGCVSGLSPVRERFNFDWRRDRHIGREVERLRPGPGHNQDYFDRVGSESANPLMSRTVAANTSGIAFRKIISPP
jgi:hypothetical protein